MTTPRARLGAFALVMAGSFATAYGIGEALPGHEHSAGTDATDPGHGDHGDHGATEPPPTSSPHAGHGANGAGAGVAGLTSMVDGHRVVASANAAGLLTLRVERDGIPVTTFDENHGARLHLLLVSADLSSFQHLHPLMDTTGTWTTPVTWATPGSYRLVVDVRPTGADAMALGTDLVIDGVPSTVPLPSPNDRVTTPEGLHVMRADGLFTVTPSGELEPYLGQPAHLVAFRAGNLMYRHLHAESGSGSGQFRFAWDLPPGTWRLFLQFSRLGQVITVPFTTEVTA